MLCSFCKAYGMVFFTIFTVLHEPYVWIVHLCTIQPVEKRFSAGKLEAMPQDITKSLSLPASQFSSRVPSGLLCFILV